MKKQSTRIGDSDKNLVPGIYKECLQHNNLDKIQLNNEQKI